MPHWILNLQTSTLVLEQEIKESIADPADPSAPRQVFDSGDKGRIAAHTDFSTCTFLFQDECGGLEVEDPVRHSKGDLCLPSQKLVEVQRGLQGQRYSP
jgi:hypothetical protein